MTQLYRVRTVFSGVPGAPYLSTMYFERILETNASDAVAAVGAFWGALDNMMTTIISWATESEVVTIDDATGAPSEVESVPSITGTGSEAGPLMSRISQGLIRWRTGVYVTSGGLTPKVKEIRGRTFVPGLTEAANNNTGQLEAGNIAAMNTAATNLRITPGITLRVYSKTHATSAPVTSSGAWAQWASLRSRRD